MGVRARESRGSQPAGHQGIPLGIPFALSGISFSVYSLYFIAFCSSKASIFPCELILSGKGIM